MTDRFARPIARHRQGLEAVGWLAISLLILGSHGLAAASGPADPLLRLVAPDPSMVLAVEDFRTRAKQVEASTLDDDLKRLPLVASWLGSTRFDRLRRAATNIENGLGVPIRTVFDEVLGDAFVVVLQTGPGGSVDRSSGLVLIKPRGPKLLERLIATRNAALSKQGTLNQVITRRQGAVSYQTRSFKPGVRPDDHYVSFDDGTFAWSNSEASILEVIDRHAGTRHGFDASPSFKTLRAGLPDKPLASLFVAPAVVAEALGTSLPASSSTRRHINAFASKYLTAARMIGFAVEYRDGFVFHSHEVLDPSELPDWLRGWMARPSKPSPLLGSIPPSAFGVVSARFDFARALGVVRLLVEDDDRTLWETAEQAAQGLALGQPLDDLLPQVDSHVVFALSPKTSPNPWDWYGLAGAAAWVDPNRPRPAWVAVDNAFKTGMSSFALRPYRRSLHVRVETEERNGRRVTKLGPGDKSVLAYQSNADHLIVGNSGEAVAEFAASPGFSASTSPLAGLRDRYAGDAETFAVIDLPRLVDVVQRSRNAVIRDLAGRSGRPLAEVDGDLGHVLSLARLFRGVVATSNANRDATEVHRTLGLIAR